ncbi:hypothetical protein NM688_g5625 [Phlebia brevispora]|uniref:Uncharacterized protein n=1 Tax=Phlebia brevispora TaxID=194682 RepID=A0ACC1SSM9_9APHY|nr:hypothetical protein NM688_g5625 [Phlebia brevispora]
MNVVAAVVVLATSYFLLVRILRYRHLSHLQHVYGSVSMTPWIAQRILHVTLFYEFPSTMLLGTIVALFKIYGIPTVSSLLLRTGELKTRDSITRRLADTGTLIATWITNPLVGPGSGLEPPDDCSTPVDPRGALAIARVNWLHRKYPILNDDYKYNLALFVLEPLRLTSEFGWRPLTQLERQAIFVFWMEIGRRMGIQDLWTSFEEMEEWAESYAQEKMVPSQASADLANIAIGHFTYRIPNVLGLRNLMKDIVACFLDERTRRAMMWVSTEDPPADYLLRLQNTELPRMHTVYKRPYGPWYYPEPKGISKVVQNLRLYLGLTQPDKIPSRRWKSEGYRIEELGPIRFESEGHEAVMQEAASLQGTPVVGPWALDGGRSRN